MAPVATPFEVFFDLVPTGAVRYAPLFDASGDVVDFRFVRLNPAGQRLLGLPAQPTCTFREQYPHSVPTGIFAQYRTAYLMGQAATYDVPYKADGFDTLFGWWPSAAVSCWCQLHRPGRFASGGPGALLAHEPGPRAAGRG